MTIVLFVVLFFLLFVLTPANWRNGFLTSSFILLGLGGFSLHLFGVGATLVLAGLGSFCYLVVLIRALNGTEMKPRSTLLGE